jgi:cytochrome c-type biogenesis protein CcmH
MRHFILSSLLCAFVLTAYAGIEVHQFTTPEQEARYKKLTDELRCLVCQNQNLADSNAPLARQLRDDAYQMIKEGKTDQQVIDFMVQRYGDFVLYSPPLKPTTYVLWIGPFVLLVFAVFILQVIIRRNRNKKLAINTTDFEKARKLLAGEDEK